MFGSRDLRLVDNDALFAAHNSGLPLLLVYFFEPSVMNYDDADVRHWLVYESIQDYKS
jgi:deoxyribodipyrimidine photo-lyase